MSVSPAELRAAHARWCQQRRKLIALGQWQPFVEAGPVRDRIHAINRAGMPTTALADKLGLPESALGHLMWKRDGVPSRQVRTETAELVMVFWPTLDDFPAASLIDATGTKRRVQALMTLGWTQRYLAGRAGISERSISRALGKERVTATFARNVAALYDELWRRSPDRSEVDPQAAQRLRQYATAMKFVSPLGWDDETIDDPEAVPQTDAEKPVLSEGVNLADRWLLGEAVVLGPEDRKQVIRHLFEWTTLTKEEIGERLEMKPAAVEKIWVRLKKQARLAGETEPVRRVFGMRDKALEKKDMEAAA